MSSAVVATIPILAQAIWTAAMRGQGRNAVHSSEVPSWAPAIEYVAMPEGSSSAAPVMTPGPRMERKRRIGPCGARSFFLLKTTPRESPLPWKQHHDSSVDARPLPP